MGSFRRWIIVGNGKLNFFFTRIYHVGGCSNYVAVIDRERNLHSFRMQENENSEWKIDQKEKMPSWILDVEGALSEAINESKE